MAEEKDLIRMTIRFPSSTHHKLKMLAGWERKGMMEILVECVEERFDKSGLPTPKAQEELGKGDQVE